MASSAGPSACSRASRERAPAIHAATLVRSTARRRTAARPARPAAPPRPRRPGASWRPRPRPAGRPGRPDALVVAPHDLGHPAPAQAHDPGHLAAAAPLGEEPDRLEVTALHPAPRRPDAPPQLRRARMPRHPRHGTPTRTERAILNRSPGFGINHKWLIPLAPAD